MRLLLINALLATSVPSSGFFAPTAEVVEVVVKAGEMTPVDEGVALRCNSRDDRNFKGYPVRKNSRPYVVSLSWQLRQPDSVLVMLSDEESSRMLLFASGASHPPQAIGSDNPPPPPPGRGGTPTDRWTNVSKLLLFKEGGRFFVMNDVQPRDFLFELPAGAGSPEALRFQVGLGGKKYSVRCDLGR